MASFNKVILAGNLTRDPELRTLPSSMAVVKFSLAINRRYTNKDGQPTEETTFVEIDSFGKQAETIAKYCTKGSSLLVEGRLKFDQWNDKTTGEKRTRLGVVLENFTFLSSRNGNNGSATGDAAAGSYDDAAPARRSSAPAARPAQPPPPASDPNIDESDVPF